MINEKIPETFISGILVSVSQLLDNNDVAGLKTLGSLLNIELDLLAFGDETARGRGQSTELMRGLMMVLCAIASGATVAAAGLVGFIGLIAPHLARTLVGHSHKALLPVTAICGGMLVVGADLAGRTLFGPAQLPVGLMTAMIGAPVFAVLLWRRANG